MTVAFLRNADAPLAVLIRDAEFRDPLRSVEIDESGRIFEMTGERFNMPGLEPANILDALDDERFGRVRSLKEIIAARGQHGL